MRLPTFDKPRIIGCAEEIPPTSVCQAVAWTSGPAEGLNRAKDSGRTVRGQAYRRQIQGRVARKSRTPHRYWPNTTRASCAPGPPLERPHRRIADRSANRQYSRSRSPPAIFGSMARERLATFLICRLTQSARSAPVRRCRAAL